MEPADRSVCQLSLSPSAAQAEPEVLLQTAESQQAKLAALPLPSEPALPSVISVDRESHYCLSLPLILVSSLILGTSSLADMRSPESPAEAHAPTNTKQPNAEPGSLPGISAGAQGHPSPPP